jgi:hypothetical protein
MAVAFGGGGFVMGAYSAQGSKLFYSLDVTNWDAATPRESITDYATPYYNVLLPVKAPGMDLMIAAGSIWSPIRLGTPASLNSMPAWQFETVGGTGYAMSGAYGNGLFVLIGIEMATMVSTNGRDWSARIIGEPWVFPNPPTPEYIRLNYLVGDSVAFGNGTFVVVSQQRDILVSTNAFWERRPISIGPGLRGITYGAGRFVVVGGKNIYASAHVSTPGLAFHGESAGRARLELSGEIDREYVLEQSPDLIRWTEADRFRMPLPNVERVLDISSGASFYRARLVE